MMNIVSATVYVFTKSGTQSIDVFYEDDSDQFVPNDPDNSDYQQYMAWAPDHPDDITYVNINS